MIVLVCGGRRYDDRETVFATLDKLNHEHAITLLIEGGSRGADWLARTWALERDVEHVTYWAEWENYGRRAGPIRNQRMLDAGKPELVVAFPGGDGTADMVARARKAGVRVLEVGS